MMDGQHQGSICRLQRLGRLGLALRTTVLRTIEGSAHQSRSGAGLQQRVGHAVGALPGWLILDMVRILMPLVHFELANGLARRNTPGAVSAKAARRGLVVLGKTALDLWPFASTVTTVFDIQALGRYSDDVFHVEKHNLFWNYL